MTVTALPPAFPATVRTRDGLALHAHAWPVPDTVPARGVAVIVHGLGEHLGRYAHVAARLNAQGWHVFGCDHRGHGRSPGARGALNADDDFLHDTAAVVDAARAACPGLPLLLVGHSLGGAIAARFVAAHAAPPESAPWARPVNALVLSSPALEIPISTVQKGLLATVGKLTPDVAVGNGLKPAWICHNPATVAAYLADPLVHDRVTGRLTRFLLDAGDNVLARAPHWTVPTLITWGGEDRCVRPQGSEAFVAQAPRALVHAVPWPRLSHEVFNEVEQDQVLDAVMAWLGGIFGG
jgi:alpha-beta hydrolase superfamily lysophospholipase